MAAPRRNPQAQQQKPPTDLTGTKMQKEAEAKKEEQRQAAERMAMATAQQQEIDDRDEVIDLTNGPLDEAIPEQRTDIEIASDENPEVEEVEDEVVIRVNADLSQVTYGAGKNYNFAAGRSYKVPRGLAEHLEEKGYVWH
jgi:hypothetical protein